MKRDFRFYIIPGLFLITEVCLSFGLGIWLDESFTLHRTAEGFMETIRRSVVFEAQTVMYFASLWLLRTLGPSIFVARLFSIIAATASVIVFQNIVRKHLRSLNPTITTLLFAFNPMLLWAGLEIRVYALYVLMGTLILRWFMQH